MINSSIVFAGINNCADKTSRSPRLRIRTIVITPLNLSAAYRPNDDIDTTFNSLVTSCCFLLYMSSKMTDVLDDEQDSVADGRLEYPRDFFEPVKGSSPPDIEAAALLWQYRKARPPKNGVDTQPADGALMMQEIKEMRSRFRASINTQFMDSARTVAREVNLVMSCGTVPVTPKDLKQALCSLSNNEENNILVFRICHDFHKDRQWMSNAIDEWFREENMKLLDATKDSTAKSFACCRGGFGHVARQSKSYAVQSLMRPMLKQAKWCIATTNNLRNCNRLEYKGYDWYDEKNHVKNHFYVVTKRQGVVSGDDDSALNDSAISNQPSLQMSDQQLVDVRSLDYTGMASTLSQQIGAPVSETALKTLILKCCRANLSGSTMVLVQNSESMTTMTSADNNRASSKGAQLLDSDDEDSVNSNDDSVGEIPEDDIEFDDQKLASEAANNMPQNILGSALQRLYENVVPLDGRVLNSSSQQHLSPVIRTTPVPTQFACNETIVEPQNELLVVSNYRVNCFLTGCSNPEPC